MTDATAGDTTAAEGEGKPKRRRLVLVAAGVLTVLAVAAGLYLALGRHGVGKLVANPGKEAAAGQQQQHKALFDFKEMVVNISGSSATGAPTTRFLKIQLQMVYNTTPQTEQLLKDKQPYLRDAIIGYLRQLSEDDLRGSDGLFLLKAELLKRARAIVGNDAPQEFLIGELVMQ